MAVACRECVCVCVFGGVVWGWVWVGLCGWVCMGSEYVFLFIFANLNRERSTTIPHIVHSEQHCVCTIDPFIPYIASSTGIGSSYFTSYNIEPLV